MFTFNHTTKTVLNTHNPPTVDEQSSVVEYSVNRSDAQKLDIENGDTLLVLLTTGDRSILTQPTAVVENTTYEFPIDADTHAKLGVSPDDIVTSRITNLDKFTDLSFSTDELVMVAHEPVYGTDTDPTDGSWLFIDEYTLNYSESENRVAGRIHIPKTPYRDHIAFNTTDEHKFKALTETASETFTRHLIDNGHGVTIPTDVLNALGVTKNNRTVDVWVHTTSLTPEETTTHPDKQLPETEHDSSDRVGHAIQTVKNKNFETIEQPDDPVDPPTTNIETVSPDAFTDTDTIDGDHTTEYTPVVLLDDSERLQENWVGHYMRPNGDLVCEKPYTDAVEDPAGRHYDKVCLECAVKQPDALRDRDISQLLSDTLDISISNEAPYLLDKETAAKAVVNALQLKHPSS